MEDITNKAIQNSVTNQSIGESNIGTVDGNIVGALCYLGGILSAILLIMVEKNNKFVRFHAIQSIITFVVIFVLTIVLVAIPIVGWILSPLIWLSSVITFIFLTYKAYQGEKFKLPMIGDIAEKQVQQ